MVMVIAATAVAVAVAVVTAGDPRRPLRSPAAGLPQLLRLLRPHRRLMVLAGTCSVLNKLFDLAPPVLIGLAVDVVVKRDGSWLAGFGVSTVPGQLTVLAVLSFLVWSAESLFEYLYALLWRNLAQTVQHDLRLEGYDHLQHLEMEFLKRVAAAGCWPFSTTTSISWSAFSTTAPTRFSS